MHNVAGYDLGAYWIDELSGTKLIGHVLNSYYCPVTNRWLLLIAGEDGKFHSLPADNLELRTTWIKSTEERRD